jgi:hypothetical protein
MVSTLTLDFATEIKKKWAKKSKAEKNDRVNKLITLILEGNIPYDEIEEFKEEASIIAKMLIR